MSSEESDWGCWNPNLPAQEKDLESRISLEAPGLLDSGNWEWESQLFSNSQGFSGTCEITISTQLPKSFLLHTRSPSGTKCSFKSKTNAYSQTVSKNLHRCTGTLDTARFLQFPMPTSELPLSYMVLPSRSGFYPLWRLPLLWGKALSPVTQDLVLATSLLLLC